VNVPRRRSADKAVRHARELGPGASPVDSGGARRYGSTMIDRYSSKARRRSCRMARAASLLALGMASSLAAASADGLPPSLVSARAADVAIDDPRVPPAIAARLPAPLTDTDFRTTDPARVELGRLLFHEPLLSGNRNIACSTCHHSTLASADGTSLGVGEGGLGLGPARRTGPGRTSLKHRVPRHSPALFNLGAHEFTTLFHDGRVTLAPDEPRGYDTPAEEYLPDGLPSVLAAQALFPLLAEIEMAGSVDSNDVAAAAARRRDHGWRVIERRLRDSEAWLPPFVRAFPSVRRAADIDIVHVAHALDDFINAEWRASASPFDHWLAGDVTALDDDAVAGLVVFHGKGGCDRCHAGPLQTDHAFHALMLPPLGPGRTRAFDSSNRDPGRMNVTDDPADAYRFRTPSLRNVARTAPYGHAGTFATLEGIVRHHLDPRGSLARWNRTQAILFDDPRFAANDFLIHEDAREMARYARHLDLAPTALDDEEIDHLLAFLDALTDERSLSGSLGPPAAVPSGLPLDQLTD